MPRKQTTEDLLNKIASNLGMTKEEAMEESDLTTFEDKMIEGQSVLDYYTWRRSLTKKPKETDDQFNKRLDQWKYKQCKSCKETFAYNFHYDGVAYCSLMCLDQALRDIGLVFHYNRDLNKRWGYTHPSIINSQVLKLVEQLFYCRLEVSSETGDQDLPKYLQDQKNMSDSSLHSNDTFHQYLEHTANILYEQDNLDNTSTTLLG